MAALYTSPIRYNGEFQVALREIAKYLVAKRLAGDLITIQVIYDYIVNDMSPADVAAKWRIYNKYMVRGYAQRVFEKVPSSRLHVKRIIASEVLKAIHYPLLKLRPIVVKSGAVYLCLKCGREVFRAEAHVRKAHKAEIEEAVNKIVEEVMEED